MSDSALCDMAADLEAQREHQSIHSPHSYRFYLSAFNNKRDFCPPAIQLVSQDSVKKQSTPYSCGSLEVRSAERMP